MYAHPCRYLMMSLNIMKNILFPIFHEYKIQNYLNLHLFQKEQILGCYKEAKKEQVIVSCDVGLTCDILDESFYKPIVVAPTSLSYSSSSTTTTTPTSTTSDSFTCDASLMVENETLKREVDELTHALGKAYGGEAHLLNCLGIQKFSLNKEGLGYTPRKARRPLLLPKLAL